MSEMPATTEASIQTLLDKLDRWLMVQPEWLLLMGLPERQIRKQVATLVAKELLLMPKRVYGGEPNRAQRRQIIAALNKSGVPWWLGAPAPSTMTKADLAAMPNVGTTETQGQHHNPEEEP